MCSTHSFYIPLILYGSHGGLESIPGDLGRKAGYTLHRHTRNHTLRAIWKRPLCLWTACLWTVRGNWINMRKSTKHKVNMETLLHICYSRLHKRRTNLHFKTRTITLLLTHNNTHITSFHTPCSTHIAAVTPTRHIFNLLYPFILHILDILCNLYIIHVHV